MYFSKDDINALKKMGLLIIILGLVLAGFGVWKIIELIFG